MHQSNPDWAQATWDGCDASRMDNLYFYYKKPKTKVFMQTKIQKEVLIEK